MEVAGCFLNVLLFCSFCLCSSVDDAMTRQVNTVPLTPDNSTFVNVFHTSAVGSNDTLHYVTSTYGYPCILVAKTDNQAQISVDWDHFLAQNSTDMEHSVTFLPTPQYVYGIQFIQLIEFEDTDDNANLSAANPNTTHRYTLSSDTVPWANSTAESRLDENLIIFKIEQNYSDAATGKNVNFMSGGSFTIKIQVHGDTSRDADLPHLQQSWNTSHIDIIIDHLQPTYDNTRYAIDIIYVSSAGGLYNSTVQLHTHKSIDDEHTPGVFQVIDLRADTTPSSFLQWKPVCYKSAERAMKTATKVKHYPLDHGRDLVEMIYGQRSLLYAYMGGDLDQHDLYQVTGVNVSFGLSQDKFYSHTYYTAWSFAIGYGEAPTEEISLLIIIIISVGLGIPVVLIMVGSLGACIHKKKKNDHSHEHSGSYTVIN